jgi:hypothetical protein
MVLSRSFNQACRQLGVEESTLCSLSDLIESRTSRVLCCIEALQCGLKSKMAAGDSSSASTCSSSSSNNASASSHTSASLNIGSAEAYDNDKTGPIAALAEEHSNTPTAGAMNEGGTAPTPTPTPTLVLSTSGSGLEDATMQDPPSSPSSTTPTADQLSTPPGKCPSDQHHEQQQQQQQQQRVEVEEELAQALADNARLRKSLSNRNEGMRRAGVVQARRVRALRAECVGLRDSARDLKAIHINRLSRSKYNVIDCSNRRTSSTKLEHNTHTTKRTPSSGERFRCDRQFDDIRIERIVFLDAFRCATTFAPCLCDHRAPSHLCFLCFLFSFLEMRRFLSTSFVFVARSRH